MAISGVDLGMNIDNMAKGFAREAEQNIRISSTVESRRTLQSMAQLSEKASAEVSTYTRGFAQEAATFTLSREEVAKGAFYAAPKPG
ncbi:MAG: hypothetical protein H7833_02045 [Magnetococcus sp. DMHC-1]|nr:hypothetical protein [Magnetococcales bacterium]